MKVPEPKQTAAGKWRIQLRIGGQSIVVSEDSKKACKAKAEAIKWGFLKVQSSPEEITLEQAFDKCIEKRQVVLSPATIRGYKKIKQNCFQELMPVSLKSLRQDSIQRSVNKMAKDKAPKYVQNAHGLLSAVLKEYYPDFRLTTALPSKTKPDIAVPDDEDVRQIMAAVKGYRVEIPILMALWMAMRVSEIRGATFDCIKDHRLHINKAIVDDENLKPVLKNTKTYSSDRWVEIPPYVEMLISDLPYQDGFIVDMSGAAIRNSFYRLLKKNGIQQFSVHSLRHANAAIMLKLGVPNKYAQERGGWSTDSVLKTVYQYTMQDKMAKVSKSVNDYFEDKQH